MKMLTISDSALQKIAQNFGGEEWWKDEMTSDVALGSDPKWESTPESSPEEVISGMIDYVKNYPVASASDISTLMDYVGTAIEGSTDPISSTQYLNKAEGLYSELFDSILPYEEVAKSAEAKVNELLTSLLLALGDTRPKVRYLMDNILQDIKNAYTTSY